MNKSKFKRSNGVSQLQRKDPVGKVRISVISLDSNGRKMVEHSLSRTFTLANTKVSDVAAAIASALLGEDERNNDE